MSSKASVTSLFNSHARHAVFFSNITELYFSVKAWKTGRVRDFPREAQIPLILITEKWQPIPNAIHTLDNGCRLEDLMKLSNQDHYNVGVNRSDKDGFCTSLQTVAYVENDASIGLFIVALTHYMLISMGNHRCSPDTIKSQRIKD